ncbi:hypothetical protein BpHYR1_022873 [Brachionus plicatilis]|uniref:Uncharacterized protein n=1 Tax=Brachionus plicatilis TaxID=10195 RepID=A0A3M7S8L4_BRAPC|nr:hypothetical protein BpHYR1_022873 [Brachionus plicatilis]
MIRTVVSFSWKIEPFRMSKFIAHKIKPSLSTETVSEQSNQFMQRNATVNDWGKWAQYGHRLFSKVCTRLPKFQSSSFCSFKVLIHLSGMAIAKR